MNIIYLLTIGCSDKEIDSRNVATNLGQEMSRSNKKMKNKKMKKQKNSKIHLL